MEGMDRYEQLNNAIFKICKHGLVNDKQLKSTDPHPHLNQIVNFSWRS